MKKDIKHFFHNVEKCSNILNPVIFTSQYFKSIFDHLSKLPRKG